MAEKILPEIEKYNAVGKHNFMFPSYDATQAEKGIELYFNTEGDVIIIGMAGTLYAYWLSVTKVADEELNKKIYDRIANEQLEYVTRPECALEHRNMKPEDLENYYKTEVKWKKEPRRRKEILANWETPFGHSYTKEEAEQNGEKFARDIKAYVELLREWCVQRECRGQYETVLQQYAEELRTAQEYDGRVSILQELLEKETYLLLSSREQIRSLYQYCRAKCRELQRRL